MSKKPSLSALVFAVFEQRPFTALAHNDWVDDVMREYENLHGRPPRDPWRAARKLHEEGKLQKVSKGVYMYDPRLVFDPSLEEFTEQQKNYIFSRDQYRCVVCGKGRADGVELHIDHIVPRDKGGRAIIDNGQVLCAQHNFLKKNLDATESGKRLFIRLYSAAKGKENEEVLAFCREILEVFEKHDVNGHIDWSP
ncbi:MAG: HNH endonuclease signature motif containing protein [Chloroflexi bacterium]|nr:HNH endonuclease signature motif containing protein [Chloroflexota bacterium]